MEPGVAPVEDQVLADHEPGEVLDADRAGDEQHDDHAVAEAPLTVTG
jgi:hypothetical protein